MAARRMPVWLAAPLWLVLTALGLGVSGLPRSWEMSLGALLGRLALRVDRRRRLIAEENMRHCLPELDAAGRARLLRANFEHYGRLILELLHIFSPVPGHWKRWTLAHSEIAGRENWERALARGKGVLFFSAHTANWEIASAVGGTRGFPSTIVTRRLTPDWLMRRVEAARLEVGIAAAYQPRTMPIVLRGLKNGETMGFMIDQYIAPPAGVKARFFGVETDTLSVLGPLAHRTGAALLPLVLHRLDDGTVHLEVAPEMERGDWMADHAESTQRLSAVAEAWIRKHPAQWLWGHRRFKNTVWPDGTPTYSRT
ncbi:MAG: hypothetical protein HY928_08360 [Elusimicrobia bacterium]|nr:hypothetical protein [Elusimicrobiota bacterium]